MTTSVRPVITIKIQPEEGPFYVEYMDFGFMSEAFGHPFQR